MKGKDQSARTVPLVSVQFKKYVSLPVDMIAFLASDINIGVKPSNFAAKLRMKIIR
jgi:hypothetical protein